MDEVLHQCEFVHEKILFKFLVTFLVRMWFLTSKFVNRRRLLNAQTLCHILCRDEIFSPVSLLMKKVAKTSCHTLFKDEVPHL